MAALEKPNQPEYQRWSKLLNGIYIVKEVLWPYVQQVLDTFHSETLSDSLGAFCCTAGIPVLEGKKGDKKWIILNEKEGRTLDCDGHCTDWLNEIAALHRDGNRKDMFSWIDLLKLNSSSWEIGKTFLTKDQAANISGPAFLDPFYLMKMMGELNLISKKRPDIHGAVKKVMDTRNELAHAAKQDIKTEDDFKIKMEEMIDLVRLLPTASQSTVDDLEKVRDAKCQELSQKELDVVQRFMRQHLDVLRSLREELAETYLAHYSHMQPVPWAKITLPINVIYQEQSLQESKGAREEDNRLFELKSFLEPSVEWGSRPDRLLIEGAPGMGKSILCRRLMGSWALGVHASCPASTSKSQAASHDKLEGSRLHQYMLVFFVRVRELSAGDLVENLLSNLVHDCWREKDRKESLFQCIRDNIKHVLIIVDGYDEGDTKQQKTVNGWLEGRELRGCTIIVTSRPGFCRPTPPPDKTYKLEGLDKKKQMKFAESFDEIMDKELGKNSATEQLRQLEHHDFLQTPLLLALVCVLAKQGQGMLPKNVTGLYSKFVEFLCKKAMHDSPKFAKDHVSKLLNLLQKIAFHLFDLKQSEITSDILSVHVSEADIDNTIEETMIDLCKLGLVCQEIKLKGLTDKQTGSFLHQSFLDYFAARHFASLSIEERSALLQKIAIHENMLVFVAGICGESEEHQECFGQMMEAWKRAAVIEREERTHTDHSICHACLLWVGELQDPAWLRADHVTEINQTLEGIDLYWECTASCFRGVTALVHRAAHDSLSSPSAQLFTSPLQMIRSVFSTLQHSVSIHEPLNLELSNCYHTATRAQLDLLHLSLPPNVNLTCEVLRLPGCLTADECECLAAVLPRLTHIERLKITVSSLTALNAVSRGFSSTSRLQHLTVNCSPSSLRDPSSAAAEPWLPSDELINNICRLSKLEEIVFRADESTLTTEDRRDITQHLTARLSQRVKVEI